MKSLNSLISKNILFFSFFVLIATSINHAKAQSDSMRIQSDTLFISELPRARYFISDVQGFNISVVIETAFFDSLFRNEFTPYRNAYEKMVKHDITSRGLFRGYRFLFKYKDFIQLSMDTIQSDYGSSPVSNESETLSKSTLPITAGDYLVKAGKSYNAVIAISLITALMAPILAPSIGAAGTVILAGGTSLISLITVVSANLNIIKAGNELNGLKNQPSLK
jgi:hypothetical protein